MLDGPASGWFGMLWVNTEVGVGGEGVRGPIRYDSCKSGGLGARARCRGGPPRGSRCGRCLGGGVGGGGGGAPYL